MGHAWGEMPGEGPIARRLRLLRGESELICAHCGNLIGERRVHRASVKCERGPERRASLCDDCGRQLWRWLHGQG